MAGHPNEASPLGLRNIGFTVYLKDAMVNLDEPVVIHLNGKEVFRGSVERTIATLHATLSGRGDRQMMYSARVTL